MPKKKCTALILTLNEETNLKQCIDSFDGMFEEVVVVDSGSQDNTIKIAESLGAKVIYNQFEGFGKQYNFGLQNISTDWVFVIDADERLTEELRKEITNILIQENTEDAYQIPRLNRFMGQWIKHCGGFFPDYQVRMWKNGFGKHEERAVHSQVIINGSVGKFKNHLLHFTYDSVEEYIKKMNNYTTLEVKNKQAKWSDVTKEWNSYSTKMKLKYIIKNVPFRPFLRFVYMYIFKKGFLDGKVGLILCVLSAFYEFISSVKKFEYERIDS